MAEKQTARMLETADSRSLTYYGVIYNIEHSNTLTLYLLSHWNTAINNIEHSNTPTLLTGASVV